MLEEQVLQNVSLIRNIINNADGNLDVIRNSFRLYTDAQKLINEEILKERNGNPIKISLCNLAVMCVLADLNNELITELLVAKQGIGGAANFLLSKYIELENSNYSPSMEFFSQYVGLRGEELTDYLLDKHKPN